MKPLYVKISIILCTLFLWAGMSMADVIHIGNFPGNDNNNSDKLDYIVIDYNQVNETNLPQALTLFAKWEWNSESNSGAWEGNNPGFMGSFLTGGTRDDQDILSGNWDATSQSNWSNFDSLYYSAKASDNFALYYANGETSGNWTIDWTAGKSGKSPDLSHISFWTAGGTTPADPVPEPATLALVGLGLAGIAGYRRKRRSS